MYVKVHFGVEHSKNLNCLGIRGYFVKLTTRLQSVKDCKQPDISYDVCDGLNLLFLCNSHFYKRFHFINFVL
jgi:hypothetical protein